MSQKRQYVSTKSCNRSELTTNSISNANLWSLSLRSCVRYDTNCYPLFSSPPSLSPSLPPSLTTLPLSLQQKERNDQIVKRWLWNDSPWRRVDYNSIPDLTLHLNKALLINQWSHAHATRFLCSCLDPFLKSRRNNLKTRFWYPSTRTADKGEGSFSSLYEEAAHHIHYNRLDKLTSLLTTKTKEGLVHQCHPNQVSSPCSTPPSSLPSSSLSPAPHVRWGTLFLKSLSGTLMWRSPKS
jgi:hypothetical protein